MDKEATRELKSFDYYNSHRMPELNQALLKWENVYNTIRPHQALGYLTPQQFLEHHQQNRRKGKVSPIT